MISSIVLITIILILRLQVLSKGEVERLKYEKNCCNAVLIIIVLLAALRKPVYDTDMWGYYLDYIRIFPMSFSDVVNDVRFQDYLGYYFTSKVFSLTGLSYQFWFGFVEALYVYSLMKFIDKYSEDKLFSIFVFITCGMYSFSFYGLKQVMSMSLMMLAFLKFINKKYWLSVLLVAYSYLCHSVGLCFLLAFILYYYRNKKHFISYVLLSMILMVTLGMRFFANAVSTFSNEHYEQYLIINNTYSYTTFIFYVVTIAIASWGYGKYKAVKPEESKLMFGFSIVVCGMQFMAHFSPNLFRLALYYCPFMMIFLPNATHFILGNDKIYIRFVLISTMAFYYLYTSRNSAYFFFWQ